MHILAFKSKQHKRKVNVDCSQKIIKYIKKEVTKKKVTEIPITIVAHGMNDVPSFCGNVSDATGDKYFQLLISTYV